MKTYSKSNASLSSTSKTVLRSEDLHSQINNIQRLLSSTAKANTIVRKERGQKGGCCAGAISIYRESDRALLANAGNGRLPRPLVKFAFYESTFRQGQLGSVAIYGEEAAVYYGMVSRHGSLFGLRVADIRMEKGLSEFVDIKFAS